MADGRGGGGEAVVGGGGVGVRSLSFWTHVRGYLLLGMNKDGSQRNQFYRNEDLR